MTEISLAAEPIFKIGNINISNSLLTTWLVILTLIILVIINYSKIRIIPKGITNFFESIVEMLFNLVESVTNDRKKALEFLPFIGTFFIFIVFNNWFGLVPGVGTILINNGEHVVPLLRGGNADLNSTLALAVVSVVATQYYGMKHIGFVKHWKKYFSFFPNLIMGFVGVLEFLGEFSKMVSFSFRLFGNIFAGEVLLIVIAFLAPLIAPIPFFGLEIFVGLVQALVFSMLTLVFLTIATAEHH